MRNKMSKYDEIKNEILELSYRDKLRLAQLLIQLARKEEEEFSVGHAIPQQSEKKIETVDTYVYALERVLKSRPSKLVSLENFISAMFQFQGSITEDEKQDLIKKLIKNKVIHIEGNKVIYLK